PHHGPGAEHVVSDHRSEPANVRAEHLRGEGERLQGGHASRVPDAAVPLTHRGTRRSRAMNRWQRSAFHLLLLLALVAALWAAAVVATGGFAIGHGAWRFRARSPLNPFIAAIAAFVAALLLLPAGG